MESYNKTDKYIHQLAQLIAKFNRAYSPKQADDSHTNLAFDPISARLVGRWVNTKSGKIMMSLQLSKLSFNFHDAHWNTLNSIAIAGETDATLEQSIKAFLMQLELDPTLFLAPLHFTIPNYEFIHNPYPLLDASALKEWAAHRALANNACNWLMNHLQLVEEARLWPHHFDTGIYIKPSDQLALGFGLAMKDSMIGAPYYYYSAYGLHNHSIDYKSLVDLSYGKWAIHEKWKGAVLTLDEATPLTLYTFIKEVTAYYLNNTNILSHE